MFLIAVVSRRTGFAGFLPFFFASPEILYTPHYFIFFYLYNSSCTLSEILYSSSSRCEIIQEYLITKDIYHADKRRILPAWNSS